MSKHPTNMQGMIQTRRHFAAFADCMRWACSWAMTLPGSLAFLAIFGADLLPNQLRIND
jgi:hypothetical protein